jgi:hypothetical protein
MVEVSRSWELLSPGHHRHINSCSRHHCPCWQPQSEGGGRWWWLASGGGDVHSCSRVMKVGDSKQLALSKTSVCKGTLRFTLHHFHAPDITSDCLPTCKGTLRFALHRFRASDIASGRLPTRSPLPRSS